MPDFNFFLISVITVLAIILALEIPVLWILAAISFALFATKAVTEYRRSGQG